MSLIKKRNFLVVALIVALAVFMMTACEDSSKESGKKESNTVEQEASQTSQDSYFKNDVAKTPDFTIKITKVKVIPKGNKGNEYGEKPVIAFWYKTTNDSGEDLIPGSAWIEIFKAYQDNDPNRMNELDVGASPDDRFLDTQNEKIKKGGTVENAVAYELDDTKTPVKLVAELDFGEVKLGEIEYKLSDTEGSGLNDNAPVGREKPSAADSSDYQDDVKMTAEQQNAYESAQSYLESGHFSKRGLIDQLSSEYGDGYKRKDAKFAVRLLEKKKEVSWKKQACGAAKDYLETGSFSKSRLIDQLCSEYGDQFTRKQAQYAVKKVYK